MASKPIRRGKQVGHRRQFRGQYHGLARPVGRLRSQRVSRTELNRFGVEFIAPRGLSGKGALVLLEKRFQFLEHARASLCAGAEMAGQSDVPVGRAVRP